MHKTREIDRGNPQGLLRLSAVASPTVWEPALSGVGAIGRLEVAGDTISFAAAGSHGVMVHPEHRWGARRAQAILISTSNAEMAYELFGSYLMKTQKELITSFLDETGVSHEEGMLDGDEANSPDVSKLDDALKKLDGDYNSDDVTLYLSICAEQWSQSPEIEAAWRARLG